MTGPTRSAGLLALLLAAACAQSPARGELTGSNGSRLEVTPVAALDEPWAMTFLPDGRALITEKRGRLLIVALDGTPPIAVDGVPAADYGGQGGLGDVILHPAHRSNGVIYLSYAEAGDGDTRGAAVTRARLTSDGGTARLEDATVIWRQEPKVSGRGHFGHRLVFAPDGYLFITSGERQKFTPAQDMQQNLGKILRLDESGGVPADNPFANRGGVTAQVWSLGHRNPLGIAFDDAGRLWAHEMGPSGGDEMNRIRRGANYGYPVVSNGDHYGGSPIPDHDTHPEFQAPATWWTPVISPAGLVIYSGEMFPSWRGAAFIGGLSARGLIRLSLNGERAEEAERFDFGRRIREVEQGPDGTLWVLEDGSGGRLLKLTPAG